MNKFLKRNSKVKNVVALSCVIIGLIIQIHPLLNFRVYLNGPLNLFEFLLTVGFMMVGIYLIVDWDCVLNYISLNDEDDEEYEDQ